MSAVDEGRAHQRALSAQDPGIDPLQLVPAGIVVAIAGGAVEVRSLDSLLRKGGQDLFRVAEGDPVDLRETAGTPGLRPGGQLLHLLVHDKKLLFCGSGPEGAPSGPAER